MNKILKRTLQGIVAAAIISGTYFGRGKNDFLPFYSHKSGDSYGINVAFYTEVDTGVSINGLNISLFTKNYGKINGANIGLFNSDLGQDHKSANSVVNGLELSLGNVHEGYINGVQIGFFGNGPTDNKTNNPGSLYCNGLQLGIFVNVADKLNGVQLGVLNESDDKKSFLLNIDYNGR